MLTIHWEKKKVNSDGSYESCVSAVPVSEWNVYHSSTVARLRAMWPFYNDGLVNAKLKTANSHVPEKSLQRICFFFPLSQAWFVAMKAQDNALLHCKTLNQFA
jgi:hypothetical protein